MSDRRESAIWAAAQRMHDAECPGDHALSEVPNHARVWERRAKLAIEGYERELNRRAEISVRIAVKGGPQHGITLQAAVLVDGMVLTELRPATLYGESDSLVVRLPEPLVVMS